MNPTLSRCFLKRPQGQPDGFHFLIPALTLFKSLIALISMGALWLLFIHISQKVFKSILWYITLDFIYSN